MTRKALQLFFLFATLIACASAQTPWRGNCTAASIVTPGHAFAVECWVDEDRPALRAELYRIAEGDALALQDGTAATTALGSPLATATLMPSGDRNTYTATLAPAGTGAYDVRIYDGALLIRSALATVSRFGLATIPTGSGSLYVPIDLADFSVDRSEIAAFDAARSTTAALSRAPDGAFFGPASSGSEVHAVYARGADGSLAFASPGYGYGELPHAHIFVQTDRPIYRPGDTVQIRAILRTGTIGDYGIERKPVVLDVLQGYPQHAIARRTLTPDAFGTIATSASLAPDAGLGAYSVLIDGQYAGTFSVEAYKKPEYTLTVAPSAPYTISGDDVTFRVHLAYLFGASASGLSLHYAGGVNQYRYGWYGPFAFHGTGADRDYKAVDGTVTTDTNGDATVTIPTKHDGLDGSVSLQIDTHDASGRTVTQTANQRLVAGTFHIVVEPRSWIAQAGVESVFDVRSLTHEGEPRPNEAMHVRIYRSNWNHFTWVDATLQGQLDIRSDASGHATFGFTPHEAGEYFAEVRGTDERANTIETTQYIWVLDPHAAWQPPTAQPRIISHKTTFAPGETLRATLVLSQPAKDAIVAVFTDRLIEQRVVRLSGLSAELAFDPPRDAQTVTVHAYIPGENGLGQAQAALTIAPPPSSLVVRVAPERATYRPGETARIRLHATDVRGKPVRAEIALGVVDEGIYAIEPDTSDPSRTFYPTWSYFGYAEVDWYRPNALPVQTIAKVTSAAAGLVRGAVAADVYNVNASSEQGVPEAATALRGALRSHFADTAYWSPSVTTDAHGDATVAFTWPENLTTWRASALAVTAATQLGSGTADMLVTKPLLVRLEIPRFLRAGDRAIVTGIAHGPARATVRMQLDPGSLGTMEPPLTLAVDGNRRATATWPVLAPGVGSALLALRATDGSDDDGMQLPLPLLGATALEHDRNAGSLDDRTTVPTPLGPGELAGDLHLSFAPSMIAQLAQTLRVFDVYPYYCTEQTSSNGIVAAAMLLAGAKHTTLALPSDPVTVIGKARIKLNELRHGDGLWGWWNGDEDSLFMTAYAVYALDLMDRATGVDDRQDVGLRYEAGFLAKLLSVDESKSEDDEEALAAYAIARARPGALPASAMQDLAGRLRRADALTVAFTGLAAKTSGDDALAMRAAKRLLAMGTSAQGVVFWHDRDWDWRWWSDPIASTALSALLLHQTGYESQAQAALAFVREQRSGDWWYTTLDTAMASMAIAEIEGPNGAAVPNETVHVLADGVDVRDIDITSLLPDASDTHVVIPAATIRNARRIEIVRTGTGRVYWASDFQKYADANAAVVRDANEPVLARLFAKAPALSIRRRYTPPHAGAWRVGDAIACELWLTAPAGAEYVTVEDPYPAGVEYQIPQGQGGYGWSWSGAQFLDDRAAFFVRRLAPGQTLRLFYTLRATTPGRFTAPGPSAYASYGPPISAVGTGEQVTILP